MKHKIDIRMVLKGLSDQRDKDRQNPNRQRAHVEMILGGVMVVGVAILALAFLMGLMTGTFALLNTITHHVQNHEPVKAHFLSLVLSVPLGGLFSLISIEASKTRQQPALTFKEAMQKMTGLALGLAILGTSLSAVVTTDSLFFLHLLIVALFPLLLALRHLMTTTKNIGQAVVKRLHELQEEGERTLSAHDRIQHRRKQKNTDIKTH